MLALPSGSVTLAVPSPLEGFICDSRGGVAWMGGYGLS